MVFWVLFSCCFSFLFFFVYPYFFSFLFCLFGFFFTQILIYLISKMFGIWDDHNWQQYLWRSSQAKTWRQQEKIWGIHLQFGMHLLVLFPFNSIFWNSWKQTRGGYGFSEDMWMSPSYLIASTSSICNLIWIFRIYAINMRILRQMGGNTLNEQINVKIYRVS